MSNYNLLAELVRGKTREQVVAELDLFLQSRGKDQARAKEVIEALLQKNASQEVVAIGALIPQAVSRLVGDSLDNSFREAMIERCREVCNAIGFTKKGMRNPFYSPDSRTLAQQGAVR